MDKIIENYYCFNCFEDFTLDLTDLCKSAMNITEFRQSKYHILKLSIDCPNCGKSATFMVDKDMINLIRMTNKMGYETYAHCSGHSKESFFHSKDDQAYIALYANKKQIEEIKKIPHDDKLIVEYSVRILDPGMTDPTNWCWDTIILRYNAINEDYSDLKDGIQLMYDFISKFPASKEFYENIYADNLDT